MLLAEEKHALAVHEGGHAFAGAERERRSGGQGDNPAGRPGTGATEQLPLVQRHLLRDYLDDSLAVRLGGRAAEPVVLGQGSTGAANDLAGATELAIKMVREFGLSKSSAGSATRTRLGVLGGGGGVEPAVRRGDPGRNRPGGGRPAEGRPRPVRRAAQGPPRAADSLVGLLLEKETVDGKDVTAGRPSDRSLGPCHHAGDGGPARRRAPATRPKSK